MPHTPRIGIQIDHEDPFWVQVREAIWQHGLSCAAELIEVSIQENRLLSADEQVEVVEDLIVQELDVLICNTNPPSLLTRMLDRGIPIIYVSEIALRHAQFASRTGLADSARMLGELLELQLPPTAHMLMIGGQGDGEDSGQSRIDGFTATLSATRIPTLHTIPSGWLAVEMRPLLERYLQERPEFQIDAIFGLSDSLALAARDICQAWGRLRPEARVLGINGDPLALAAINAGRMTATVETDVDDMAAQALELALQAARGAPIPDLFRCEQRLITIENVADAALRKSISLASLPTRLIEVNRHNEQQRQLQIELSQAIDRNVGLILDEQQLLLALTTLIRDSYGFDNACFLNWNATTGQLTLLGESTRQQTDRIVETHQDHPLMYALARNQLVFIPDTNASHRFAPDPEWPDVRARAVVPVRLGGQPIGLLDLHRHEVIHHTRAELAGLQLLADRIGISMRNAQLYSQELKARTIAEQADRLKTALLANVSHELRTPLNVILGYSRSALDMLAAGTSTAANLADDLTQIYHSGEHLLRLINDLLDLSRTEIGALELLPERIDTPVFLHEILRSSAESFGAGATVAWELLLPPELPPLYADPVRLRQILLNLLHNAHKFTEHGSITLGAETLTSELHLWVADTGPGIPPELQEHIFVPFVSASPGERQREGIGLGLSITRRLVALHNGRLVLESRVGQGSTFHVYLPLPIPTQHDQGDTAISNRVLLLISEDSALPDPLIQLAERRGLSLHLLRSNDNLTYALQTIQPALLALDVATATDNGWQVIEEIRSRPELHRLPVMIYNGAADAAIDTAGAATGLLLKPLGDEALIEALIDLDPSMPDGTILIVEDDPQIRALHRRLIAQHFPGYTIRDVGDGRAALAEIARTPPNLIVLDLVIPEPDGFAILEALRADSRTATMPVLVLSGKTLTGDELRRLCEARVIFQTKGILSPDELAESFRRAMNNDERLPPHTSALVKQSVVFIQQHYAEPLSRQDIADAIGVNKDYLGRIFQKELGLSPWEYLIRYRLLRAKELLRTTALSITAVASRVGFETPTYFSQIFHREVGCSPRVFRTGRQPA